MSPLKWFRLALTDQRIIGLSKTKIVLENGYWWKLSVPFEGNRLELVGQKIKSVRIIDDQMELAIGSSRKLYLHWREKSGNIIGPQFPEPGKIRCWDQTLSQDLIALDKSFEKIEELLNGHWKVCEGTEQGNPSGPNDLPTND